MFCLWEPKALILQLQITNKVTIIMPSILVIDDDASIAETLDLYLTEEGYKVRTALTGTEGLNKYVQEPSDVVILDIRLPDVDGFSVLEDLKEENENVKVIMITAFHDMETTINAMKGGAFDYIHKPINVDELDLAIKKALKSLEMEKKIDGLLMEPSRSFRVGDIIGTGNEMREIFKTIGTCFPEPHHRADSRRERHRQRIDCQSHSS